MEVRKPELTEGAYATIRNETFVRQEIADVARGPVAENE
jgi:hypothetical protein